MNAPQHSTQPLAVQAITRRIETAPDLRSAAGEERAEGGGEREPGAGEHRAVEAGDQVRPVAHEHRPEQRGREQPAGARDGAVEPGSGADMAGIDRSEHRGGQRRDRDRHADRDSEDRGEHLAPIFALGPDPLTDCDARTGPVGGSPGPGQPGSGGTGGGSYDQTDESSGLLGIYGSALDTARDTGNGMPGTTEPPS